MRPDGGGDDGGDGGGGGRDARLFSGVHFALYGFDIASESQIRREILGRGGEEVAGHGAAPVSQVRTSVLPRGGEEEPRGNVAASRSTHLIVHSSILFDNLKCVEAREQGLMVVTKIWVEFSVSMNKLEDPDRLLYMPARGLRPIPGFSGLNICCVGYGERNTKYIMKLIEVAGAVPHDYIGMCEADVLICSAFQGRDYDLSVKMKMDAVTLCWLRDCILQWRFIPFDNYTKQGQQLLMVTPTKAPTASSHLRILNTDIKDSVHRPRMSPSMLERGAFSAGSKRNRSSFNNDGYEFVRIDHPKCKKTLNLDASRNCYSEGKIGNSISNPEVTGSCSKDTSEARPSKCPESVEVTPSATQTVTLQGYASKKRLIKFSEVPGQRKKGSSEVTKSNDIVRRSKDEVKLIYIDSFSAMAKIHKRNYSLGGQFGPENFVVCLADHSIRMVDLSPLVPYSETVGNMDYQAFIRMVRSFYEGEIVPQDVSNWLELISKGVQSPSSPVLISNHLLMMQDEAAYGMFTLMYHCMLEFKETRNLEFKIMLESEGLRKYKVWKSWYLCRILKETLCWEDPVTHRTAQYENNIMGILQLIRNCCEHKARGCLKEFLSIIFSLNADLLPDLQRILMEEGYLKHLRI